MKLDARPLTPSLGIRSSLKSWMAIPPRQTFDAGTVADARKWQTRARKVLLRCLGDAPPPGTGKVTVIERRQLDGYRRTMFRLGTARGIDALMWYCVPDQRRTDGPGPAMIATPGHGIGALDLLAMNADGSPRAEGEGYQKDYALQAVRLGYPALVIEPLGFGTRRDEAMMTGKSGETGCAAGCSIAQMLGSTLARIRVNDIQRGLDWLSGQPEVDPRRVGLMGISGGGQMTLWTSAVESRFKAIICSGYFNRFRDSVMAMAHCVCNFAPGLAAEFEMAELGALVAPRPMLLQSGTLDGIFPIRATRAEVKRLRSIYRVWDADDRIEHDIFKAGHMWSPRRVEAFLARAL